MKIEGIELRRIRIPLVAPFRTSATTYSSRDAVLVRAVGPDAEGWGECVALAEPSYSPEYVDGAHEVIRRFLVPRLWALTEVTASALGPAMAPVLGHPMAKAALEMAVLDAELRERSESFAQHLGAVREAVDCGVAVGMADSVPELLEAVEGYVEDGYRRVKLKIAPGWDVEPVAAVRERFPDIPLQVDANAAYHLSDARQLARLDPFDLLLIEQPLASDDLRGHAELARLVKTPICLDESITSARAAAEAVNMGACSVVNVKAGRVGGYLEAREVHDVCAAAGVPVWCGGMLETGLGRAANLALAAMANFTLPGDTSASARYFERDLTEPFVLDDGRLAVPRGPGLGVSPLPDLLEGFTISTEWLTPGAV